MHVEAPSRVCMHAQPPTLIAYPHLGAYWQMQISAILWHAESSQAGQCCMRHGMHVCSSLTCFLWLAFGFQEVCESLLCITVFTSSSQASSCVVMMQWELPCCSLSLSLSSLLCSTAHLCHCNLMCFCLHPHPMLTLPALSLTDSLLLWTPLSLSLPPPRLVSLKPLPAGALELDWGEILLRSQGNGVVEIDGLGRKSCWIDYALQSPYFLVLQGIVKHTGIT